MNFLFFAQGILVGAAISFPIGPIGILCLRRLLLQGPLVGIAAGLGAATADLFFASTALIGISVITNYVMRVAFFMRLMSSFLLTLLGIVIFFSKPPHAFPSKRPHSVAQSFFSTFFLTLANPLIILSFIFMFTAVGIDHELDELSELILTSSGVFVGSMIWWIILGIFTKVFRPTTHPAMFARINKWCGIAVALFGICSAIFLFIHH